MDINAVEIDVRFNEQDEMGMVHHSVYYIWFEIARYNFAANLLGITYENLKKSNFFVPVIHSECKYLNMVRFPDTVMVKCYYEPSEKNIITLHYEVFSKKTGKKAAYGKTINVFVNSNGKLLVCTPEAFKKGFKNAENNEQYLWNKNKQIR
ncbi:MAG: acyl-CoA thioesterase [Firmicutes bacterium]|nr:acyl-CoA thioesterase [Bacillota bacterium]